MNSQRLLIWLSTFVLMITACGPVGLPSQPAVADGALLVQAQVPGRFVDEAAQDPVFADWRDRLLAAIRARDAQAVSQMSSPDIKLTFGDQFGRATFVERLNAPMVPGGPEQGEAYWRALEAAVASGGRFNAADRFTAPYFYSTPIPDEWNVFDTFFVVGPPRPVFAVPDATSKPIMTLMDLGMEVEPRDTLPRGGDRAAFRAIRLVDGGTGFMQTSDLRSLVGYRAFFERRNDVWQMTIFIAGD